MSSLSRVDLLRYYILTNAFNTTNGNLSTITESISYTKGQCEVGHAPKRNVPPTDHIQDVLALGTFTANQDVPRFGSYTSDISVSLAAIIISTLNIG